MTMLTIEEVAERTGVPATTLRYYEDIGLLSPAESEGNGHRAYSERDVERLQFIVSAKQLDISLEGLRELLQAWGGQDCADVQTRTAQVVVARLSRTQERIAALVGPAAHLQAAAERLKQPTMAGPSDSGCACSTAATVAEPTAVRLPVSAASRALPIYTATTSKVGATQDRPIACTLGPGDMSGRVAEWRAVLLRATHHTSIPGGVSVSFDHDVEVTTELARLAAAEYACCSFFDFTLAITGDGVRFEVRAPDEARDMVAAIFGVPGTGPGLSEI